VSSGSREWREERRRSQKNALAYLVSHTTRDQGDRGEASEASEARGSTEVPVESQWSSSRVHTLSTSQSLNLSVSRSPSLPGISGIPDLPGLPGMS